jgi:hypothetical protein
MMIKEQGRKNAQNTQKELEVVWINYNSSNMNSNDSLSFTQWPSIVRCMKVTSPSQFSSSVLDNFRAMGTSQCNHLPQCWVSVASPEPRETQPGLFTLATYTKEGNRWLHCFWFMLFKMRLFVFGISGLRTDKGQTFTKHMINCYYVNWNFHISF